MLRVAPALLLLMLVPLLLLLVLLMLAALLLRLGLGLSPGAASCLVGKASLERTERALAKAGRHGWRE
jgi:hypothetical protein